MADSANTGGEVDERDGMVIDWNDLTEYRLVVAELIAEPEAAAEPPDDDESCAAAVLDALSMILAVSQTSRVLLQRRLKHR